MIYGTPAFTIEDDRTDMVGLRTLVLSLLWQPTDGKLSLEELDAQKPAPPQAPGGVVLLGAQTRRAGGALRTWWTFEGINGNGKDVTFKGRTNSLDYEFAPGFAEVSIVLHPKWQTLKERFGGYLLDNQVIWPEIIPLTTSSSGFTNTSDAGKLSPMLGQETWYRIDGTYSFRYMSPDIGGLANGVAKIHKSGNLPGKAPNYTDRDWLKLPVSYRRRGPVYEVVEKYWLSGDGGWPVQIYGNLDSGGYSGLTTSSLS